MGETRVGLKVGLVVGLKVGLVVGLMAMARLQLDALPRGCCNCAMCCLWSQQQ
jgi:hypothetical protein